MTGARSAARPIRERHGGVRALAYPNGSQEEETRGQ
jgi:hypothetical protein